MRPLLPLTLAATLSSLASGPPRADAQTASAVVVEVTNLAVAPGPVNCALFRGARGFPTEPSSAYRYVQVAAAEGRARCRFDGLAPGTYAVAVWHDEDGDGELDTGAFGMPREGIGATNDARGRFGPPRFADAAVRVGAGTFRQTVRVD